MEPKIVQIIFFTAYNQYPLFKDAAIKKRKAPLKIF